MWGVFMTDLKTILSIIKLKNDLYNKILSKSYSEMTEIEKSIHSKLMLRKCFPGVSDKELEEWAQ